MVDSDLADLYEIETKMLNRAVKRNITRFPANFMFQLTNEELESLRYQFGTSNNSLKSQIAISKTGRGGRRTLPYVFTEQGVAMLSSVLHTEKAIQINNRIYNKIRKEQVNKSLGIKKISIKNLFTYSLIHLFTSRKICQT